MFIYFSAFMFLLFFFLCIPFFFIHHFLFIRQCDISQLKKKKNFSKHLTWKNKLSKQEQHLNSLYSRVINIKYTDSDSDKEKKGIFKMPYIYRTFVILQYIQIFNRIHNT